MKKLLEEVGGDDGEEKGERVGAGFVGEGDMDGRHSEHESGREGGGGAEQPFDENIEPADGGDARQRGRHAHRGFAAPEHRHPEFQHEMMQRWNLLPPDDMLDQVKQRHPRDGDAETFVAPETVFADVVKSQQGRDEEAERERDASPNSTRGGAASVGGNLGHIGRGGHVQLDLHKNFADV